MGTVALGFALFEGGAAFVDTLFPDLIQENPYYVDNLISFIQIGVLSYEVGYVLNQVLPAVSPANMIMASGLGGGFFIAAAVALVILPFIQSQHIQQPAPSEVLGDTGDVEVNWRGSPSHERNQTLYLSQLISSLAACALSHAPFFLALAAIHFASYDLVRGRIDLCFSWKSQEVKAGTGMGNRALSSYSIDYYVPLFTEIPLLLQWFGTSRENKECPISHKTFDESNGSTIYTYEGTRVNTKAFIEHLKKEQEELREYMVQNWRYLIHHYTSYGQHGRQDYFVIDLNLPQKYKLGCPLDARHLGHIEFSGYTPFNYSYWPVSMSRRVWQ